MPYYILHKKIFDDICNKNVDLYYEFIETVKYEYNTIMQTLLHTTECKQIRILTHKLISSVTILENVYLEIKYICSLILSTNKNETDFNTYKPYIEMLKNYYSGYS